MHTRAILPPTPSSILLLQAVLELDPVEHYKDYEAALAEAAALGLTDAVVVAVKVRH